MRSLPRHRTGLTLQDELGSDSASSVRVTVSAHEKVHHRTSTCGNLLVHQLLTCWPGPDHDACASASNDGFEASTSTVCKHGFKRKTKQPRLLIREPWFRFQGHLQLQHLSMSKQTFCTSQKPLVVVLEYYTRICMQTWFKSLTRCILFCCLRVERKRGCRRCQRHRVSSRALSIARELHQCIQ